MLREENVSTNLPQTQQGCPKLFRHITRLQGHSIPFIQANQLFPTKQNWFTFPIFRIGNRLGLSLTILEGGFCLGPFDLPDWDLSVAS